MIQVENPQSKIDIQIPVQTVIEQKNEQSVTDEVKQNTVKGSNQMLQSWIESTISLLLFYCFEFSKIISFFLMCCCCFKKYKEE